MKASICSSSKLLFRNLFDKLVTLRIESSRLHSTLEDLTGPYYSKRVAQFFKDQKIKIVPKHGKISAKQRSVRPDTYEDIFFIKVDQNAYGLFFFV